MNSHLQRLKVLNIRKIPEKISQNKEASKVARELDYPNLNKILRLNLEDAITWNSSVLARIYKLDEAYVDAILRYVHPLNVHVSQSMTEPKNLAKSAIVIDVDRLKNEKGYIYELSSISLPRIEEKTSQINDLT